MTTDSNPAAIDALVSELRHLRNENDTLRASVEHLTTEARTLRLWLRDDAAKLSRWQDCAEQLAAVLQTQNPDNTALAYYQQLKNQP